MFFDRNAPNNADIVKIFSVWKILTFTAQEPFCHFCLMSFLPRNLTAALLRSRRRKLCIAYFRASTKSKLTPLLLLSPKSFITFREPRRSSHSHIPFGRSFNFQSTTGVICHDHKFDLCAKRKIKSRHISTLIIGESLTLASNQMLICDGFELFKRPYCLRRLNSTLNSTKNNGGESR